MRYALVMIVLAVSGCASLPSLQFWSSGPDFEAHEVTVDEVRRALLCGTPTEDARITLFDDVASLEAWPDAVDLQLDRISLPTDTAFVLVEQGLRTASGYTVELNNTAQVGDDGTLAVSAEFVEPGPDRITAEITTSLCVLASVPREPYRRITLTDSKNALRAEQTVVRN